MATVSAYSWPITLQDGYNRLKPRNFVEKGLFWLYDEKTPRIQKITVVALGLIAHVGLVMSGAILTVTSSFWLTYAAMFLLSSPLAGVMLVAGFLKNDAKREVSKICFEKAKEALGRDKAYKAIPKFGELSQHLPKDKEARRAALKDGGIRYVCTLGPEHFSDTMMRGKDFFGNHFVAFKLREKNSENPRDVMMFLCQSFNIVRRDSNGQSWNIMLVSPGKEERFDRLPVTALEQIVANTHPDYERVVE